ncbi:MAG TPA: UDP-N-acetylmuramate dehydrogenase [Nitrospirota bacterium]
MDIQDFKGEIVQNEPLSRHTSFGIGGPADFLAYPADRDDLVVLFREIRKRGLAYAVIGSGTNLLVRDKGFRGIVVCLKHMTATRVVREYRSIGGAFAVVSVEAGALLAKLLSFSVDEGLTGLEFAAGIPGTVGGAVCMNAGTAAGEMGDVVESVTLLNPDGLLVARGRDEMGFGYRTSSVPEGHLVLEATVVLRRGEKDRVAARVKDLLEGRKERQPAGFPNAGSVFKNPQEESAGRLIEQAGLKGKAVGGAQVSEIHANFIVNRGGATAADVLALMEIVRQTVLDVHGVRLEPEIKIIGEE